MRHFYAACVALVVTSVLTLCQGQGRDATLVAGESGGVVVNAVIAKIHAACILSEDRLFLRRVAYAMSEDGTASHTYQPGSDGGIWKVTNIMFILSQSCSNPLISAACAAINSELGIKWTSVAYSDLRKPLYSGLAAALFIRISLKGEAMPGSISLQALKWQTMYGVKSSLAFLRSSKLPSAGCNDQLDLAFVMDASLSVSPHSYQLMLNFTSDLVGALNMSRHAVQVAGITYSTYVHLVFGLNNYTNQQDAQNKLLKTPKEGLGTNTHHGLEQAATTLYAYSSGARRSAKKVALLITDGKSNFPDDTKTSAKNLKDLGTTVFAIGVGGFDLNELHTVASEPSCSHVLTLTSYDHIAALHDVILKSVCESNFKLTPGNPVTGNTTGNTTVETTVPGNNQTIQASVSCGILDVFVSTTNPRPSAAVHSNHYRSTPDRPAVLTVTETLPSGTIVYVTVVGTNLPPVAAQAKNCSDYNWTLAITPPPLKPPAKDTVTVAIEGGGPKGRLIATLNGQAGTVCDDAATEDLAAVVCNELGYSTTQPRLIKVTTPTTLPIVMDDAYCTGSESKLEDCTYVTVNNCDHTEDIGLDCSPANPCDSGPCENGGQCTRIDATTFTCQCTSDYTGPRCQTYVDPCAPSPCQNGGQCTRVNAGTFSCQCTTDYTGSTCQTYVDPCAPKPCQNGGQCTRVNAGTFSCQCTTDYTGSTCQTYVDPCDPNPCQNSGQCSRVSATTYNCQCTVDYTGTNCQTFIDPCDPNPCQNGGQCSRSSASNFTCQCAAGFTGSMCQTPTADPCAPNPCQNGGQCTSLSTTAFSCQCTVDYTGTTCQTLIDPCDAQPCHHNGTCIRKSVTDFECLCPPGTNGTVCEITDYCQLGYYNRLTTFSGESEVISIPCAYDMASMECGDFTVKLSGSSVEDCLKGKCFKENEAHVIAAMDVTIKSSRVTWEGSLDYENFDLQHKVTGDGSLVTLNHNRAANKTVVATSDYMLSVTLSRDIGVKLMCSEMKSSAGYPTYLCGSGTSSGMTIAGRTSDLKLTNPFSTLAYDILVNPSVQQIRDDCKDTSEMLLQRCAKPIDGIKNCNRCFREDLKKTKLSCLTLCLPRKGKCKKTP